MKYIVYILILINIFSVFGENVSPNNRQPTNKPHNNNNNKGSSNPPPDFPPNLGPPPDFNNKPPPPPPPNGGGGGRPHSLHPSNGNTNFYTENPSPIQSEDCKNIIDFFKTHNNNVLSIPNCCSKTSSRSHFINCKNGTITEIDLRFNVNSIQNEIDFSDFPIFKGLKSIIMEAKFLNKEVPPRFFEMPALQKLGILNSNIEKVPNNLNENSIINEIILYNNSLLEFPNELLKYSNLKKLDLSLNEKIEKIPKEIANLSKLNELYLQSTGLESLPEEVFSLSNLTEFDIDRNPKLDAVIHHFGKKIKNCDFRYTNIKCYEPGTCENFCTGESDGYMRNFVKENEIPYSKCTEEMLKENQKSFFQENILLIILIIISFLIFILLSILLIRSYRNSENSKKDNLDHDIYVAPVLIKRESIVTMSDINDNNNAGRRISRMSSLGLPPNENLNLYIPSTTEVNQRFSISSFNTNSSPITPANTINKRNSSPLHSTISSFPTHSMSSPTESIPTTQNIKRQSMDNKHSIYPIPKVSGSHIPEQSLSETNRRSYILARPSTAYHYNRNEIQSPTSPNEIYLPSTLKEMEALGSVKEEVEFDENDKSLTLPPYSPIGNPAIIYKIDSPQNTTNTNTTTTTSNNNIKDNNSDSNNSNTNNNDNNNNGSSSSSNNNNNNNYNNNNNNTGNETDTNNENKNNNLNTNSNTNDHDKSHNSSNDNNNNNDLNNIINHNISLYYNTNTNEIIGNRLSNTIVQQISLNNNNNNNNTNNDFDLPSYSELEIEPPDELNYYTSSDNKHHKKNESRVHLLDNTSDISSLNEPSGSGNPSLDDSSNKNEIIPKNESSNKNDKKNKNDNI